MRDITLPEVKLPDIKLPDGLRDMTRDDIVQAAHDARVRGMELQKKIEMPDIDLSKVDLSKIDLSKVELPKQISDRLPRRRRTNPLLPIAGVMAIGAAIAGVWWLFTSPVTGPRARHLAYTVKARLTGEPNDVIPYDNEANLGSLVTETNGANGSNGAAMYDESQEPAPASTF